MIKKLKRALFAAVSLMPVPGFVSAQDTSAINVLDHKFEAISPKETIHLSEAYKNKVVLVVNTASGCGFAGQLEGLEALYQAYKDKGLVVLGFPSNDFYQEKKRGDDIVEFCKLNYGVTFPLFKRSSIRGENANPLYKDLIAASGGKAPKWNFFKYLVDQNQQVVKLFSSREKPLGGKLEAEIKRLLEI